LSDQHGEMIIPIIRGSRQKNGMPAFNVSQADADALAAYVRSVIGGIGGQGKPPEEGQKEPDILVGDAHRGQVYFDKKCSGCHSATGDLQGFASKITDQKKLQSTWVAGGHESRDSKEQVSRRTPTAEVTLPSGEVVKGAVLRIDEFLITMKLADGNERTIVRNTLSSPKVVIQDPMEKHREMLNEYTDSDIHDVTAYLVTLK
jgi:cytochrome c oxidase cbb3-type subunit III